MQHPYYLNPDKFKPNTASINDWLKTRKNNSENKPGIFETVDYKSDRNWSIASILIELLAFSLTFLGAYTTVLKNGQIMFLFGAMVVVLLFIVLDIFGIMLHLKDKSRKTKNKSQYVVEEKSDIKTILYESLKETTWREFVGYMLLIISAIMKIFALMFYLQWSNEWILIIFTILYLLVVYIHAEHTVYWWPAFRLKKLINKQSDKFEEYLEQNLPTEPENTISNTYTHKHRFKSLYEMEEKSINTCANDRINIVNNGNGNYLLNAKGLIWDENIVDLSLQWGPNYTSDLINACINVQLVQVGEALTQNSKTSIEE